MKEKQVQKPPLEKRMIFEKMVKEDRNLLDLEREQVFGWLIESEECREMIVIKQLIDRGKLLII